MLHVDVHGGGPRVVLVHGFTQTGRSWGPVLPALAAGHEVLAVDAPGHGRSSAVEADMWEGARLLGAAGGRAAYLGYSMGGRLCIHLALAAPGLVSSLVLVGATAGIADPAERAARLRRDRELAASIVARGVDEFLEEWLHQPLFSGLRPDRAQMESRRENCAAGLASSLRLAGTAAQDPLWDRLHELEMPVLVVAGERDGRFSDVGRQLVECIGSNAVLALVPGAGHAAHLERPETFVGLVAPFLAATPGPAPHESSSPAARRAP